MILKHTASQNDRFGFLQSDLIITVDYNFWDRKVDSIIRVETYDHKHKHYTDITVLMYNDFFEMLMEMVNSVNWQGMATIKMKPKISYA
ncbi:MAG TPA: hypothetical protein PK339_12665 [Flavitalea sp.]|nr:hypothetical protein [Flavitalea sp.]